MSKVQALGTIAKVGYCNNCFSIVKWTDANDEITFMGNRYVECPKCGSHVDVRNAEIDYAGMIEEPAAIVNGVAYESIEEALDDVLHNDKIKEATLEIKEDLEFTDYTVIPEGKDITLDLAEGVKITTAKSIISNGNLIIEGNGEIESAARPLRADNGGSITIKSGSIHSIGDCGIEAAHNSIINIEGGEIEAQEFGAIAFTGSKINMTEGTVTAKDNAAIGGNGTRGQGDTVINIKGGELISNIQTKGYVACGVYAPNSGVVNITGGKIVANNGAGVVARGGQVNISGGEIIATGDSNTTGKVGDSRQVVTCSGVVYDKHSKYPACDSLNIKITGGKITGAKASIEVLTDEETPKIKIGKGAILTPPYEG